MGCMTAAGVHLPAPRAAGGAARQMPARSDQFRHRPERGEAMSDDPLDRLRAICLALPEAVERGGVAEHTFRVRDKIFAMVLDNHYGDGRVAAWCEAPRGMQDILVRSHPNPYFVPPYVRHHGWVG